MTAHLLTIPLYAEVILAEILKDMPKTNTQKAKVASIFAKVLDSLSEKTYDALDVSEKLLEAYAIADTVNKLTYKTVDISELKTEEINETMNKFFTRTKITSKFDKADQIIDRIDNIHIMDHIDIGAFGVKELAYLITDYNSETALLESIRKYSDDEFFNNVVDNMIADYTNKWGKILKDMGNNGVKKLVDDNILELTEKFAEKNTSTAASFLGDFTTLYKLFTFTTDITSAVSGLSKKTDALMDLSGIILIMPELDKVYDKMRTGVLSGEVTAEEFISIFELERCTKKAAYKSIMDLSGNFGTGKSNKEIANEEIDNLNDMTYTLWK